MGNMRHLPDKQASDQAASNRPSAGDSKIAQKKTKTDAQAMTIEVCPLLKRKQRSRHLPAHSSSSPRTISSSTPFLIATSPLSSPYPNLLTSTPTPQKGNQDPAQPRPRASKPLSVPSSWRARRRKWGGRQQEWGRRPFRARGQERSSRGLENGAYTSGRGRIVMSV
jgi:hypothetical protein